MVPNPFYQKKVARMVATQRTVLLRLPFHVNDLLGLTFHNFNPRSTHWVDRNYKESLFKLFPMDLFSQAKKLHEILLRIFRIRVLPRRTLLLEEGAVAKEVVIVLRGEVDIFRRLPNKTYPAVIKEQKIPLDFTKSAIQDEEDEEEGYLGELAKGFFRFAPKKK